MPTHKAFCKPPADLIHTTQNTEKPTTDCFKTLKTHQPTPMQARVTTQMSALALRVIYVTVLFVPTAVVNAWAEI